MIKNAQLKNFMARKAYIMIARAINRAKKKKIPEPLMFYQIPMEIAGDIFLEGKTFDYKEFFAICNQ